MKTNQEKAKEYLWGPAEWKRRTQFISKLIPRGASVIDLGGGLCHLYKYLEDCNYVSLDVDTFTDKTIKADFNAGKYPDIKHPFQYIVAQGVIEYMKKPKDFLRQIKKYGDVLIISYRRYVPGNWRMERKPMSYAELNTYLEVTGWERLCEKALGSDTEGPVEKVIICRKKL